MSRFCWSKFYYHTYTGKNTTMSDKPIGFLKWKESLILLAPGMYNISSGRKKWKNTLQQYIYICTRRVSFYTFLSISITSVSLSSVLIDTLTIISLRKRRGMSHDPTTTASSSSAEPQLVVDQGMAFHIRQDVAK